jgi:hypothetical protein
MNSTTNEKIKTMNLNASTNDDGGIIILVKKEGTAEKYQS